MDLPLSSSPLGRCRFPFVFLVDFAPTLGYCWCLWVFCFFLRSVGLSYRTRAWSLAPRFFPRLVRFWDGLRRQFFSSKTLPLSCGSSFSLVQRGMGCATGFIGGRHVSPPSGTSFLAEACSGFFRPWGFGRLSRSGVRCSLSYGSFVPRLRGVSPQGLFPPRPGLTKKSPSRTYSLSLPTSRFLNFFWRV